MSRLQADFLLLIAAIIWGTTFLAQKIVTPEIGPLGFVGARFALSFLVILPLLVKEHRSRPAMTQQDWRDGALLCIFFAGGVILQQLGLATTTITNAGFLTSLYVILVPVGGYIIYRLKPAPVILPAAIMTVAGVYLLNGASLTSFREGDWYVIACAVFFALQMVVLSRTLRRTNRPLTYSAIQYAGCMIVGLSVGLIDEHLTWSIIADNWQQIAYAGIVSGGIAYTLQSIAQQHTPPSDAAIIMGGEALFAALAGMIVLDESLSWIGWTGCAIIFAAMLMVEIGSLYMGRKKHDRHA